MAKASLDLAIWDDAHAWRLPNDPECIAALVGQLQPLTLSRIVLETTGGLAVGMVNSKRVNEFARAKGWLAKTDKLDAYTLAHFAQAVQPRPRPPVAAEQEQLSALVVRRRQLLQMQVAEKNRLRRVHPQVQPLLETLPNLFADCDSFARLSNSGLSQMKPRQDRESGERRQRPLTPKRKLE